MRHILTAVLAAVALLGAASAPAQVPGLLLELNKLESQPNACRTYLVAQNATNGTFSSLSVDLVLFDTEGVILTRLAVETGPMPAQKTSVLAFGIEGLSCDRVGRVLLNSVLRCEVDGAARDDCLSLIATNSRADVEFFK